MKYLISAILGLMVFSGTAMAADQTDGASSGIAVERILCSRTGQPPSGDVAYKPGVDVNGNPVTPADGNPPAVTQSHYTEVPLNVNLAQRLNLTRISDAQMAVASLRIYEDGRVLYNGQDISPQTSALCGGRAVPVPAPGSVPIAPVQNATMPTNDVAFPGTAAPSATTTAR